MARLTLLSCLAAAACLASSTSLAQDSLADFGLRRARRRAEAERAERLEREMWTRAHRWDVREGGESCSTP